MGWSGHDGMRRPIHTHFHMGCLYFALLHNGLPRDRFTITSEKGVSSYVPDRDPYSIDPADIFRTVNVSESPLPRRWITFPEKT